uniref:Uncharacterized protein n=1 Tax=Lotharella globosa TaxID=91324 RepID=A0A7S3YVN2_9EUKA
MGEGAGEYYDKRAVSNFSTIMEEIWIAMNTLRKEVYDLMAKDSRNRFLLRKDVQKVLHQSDIYDLTLSVAQSEAPLTHRSLRVASPRRHNATQGVSTPKCLTPTGAKLVSKDQNNLKNNNNNNEHKRRGSVVMSIKEETRMNLST